MIELPPDTPIVQAIPQSVEEHAAALAEILAHLYEKARAELPGEWPREPVLDVLCAATAELDALSKQTNGEHVRAMLNGVKKS
jgi:hypothetical protein